MITFTSQSDDKYIRVPLQTFATDGDNECVLHVYNYYMSSTEVVMGSMFFYEFYGYFTNTWSDVGVASQTAQIYVSNGAINTDYVYLGNEQLPQGDNPFVKPTPNPVSPSEKNGVWIGILVVLVLLLISIIAFILFKLYTNK